MTINDFTDTPLDQVLDLWKNSSAQVLLEGSLDSHYIKVDKADFGYNILASWPTSGVHDEKDRNCGCPFNNRGHVHSIRTDESAQDAARIVESTIIAIKRGIALVGFGRIIIYW